MTGDFEVRKKVDESWKDTVEKEKSPKSASSKEIKNDECRSKIFNDVSFDSFISGLSMQAMIFLGLIPNPLTKKTEVNLEQSRYIIDTIDMLKEKTIGNLTAEETELIEAALYELKMKYAEKMKD